MPAWRRALASADVGWTVAGLAAAALATNVVIGHAMLAAMAVIGAFALLAPLYVVLLVAILFANGIGASLPVGDGLLLAGAAFLGTAALVRSLIRPDWRGPQLFAFLVIGTVLARAILLGSVAPEASLLDVLHVAAPYLLVLVAAVHLSDEQLRRCVGGVAYYGAVLSLLFVLAAFTGIHFAPGTYRVEPFQLLGVDVYRVWAPGGLLFAFTFFFCMSRIALRSRGRYVLGATVSAAAMILTLSRIVVVSLFGGTLAVMLLAMFVRGRRKLAVRLSVLSTLGVIVVGLTVNGRFDLVAQSRGTTAGSFAVRATLYDQVGSILARNSGRSLGFAPGPYDFSDASLATLIVRFGPVAIVVVGLLLWAALLTRSAALAGASREDAGTVILVVPFMVFTTIASVFTDSLISSGGLALMGLALNGFLARLAALRRRTESQRPERESVTLKPSTLRTT